MRRVSIALVVAAAVVTPSIRGKRTAPLFDNTAAPVPTPPRIQGKVPVPFSDPKGPTQNKMLMHRRTVFRPREPRVELKKLPRKKVKWKQEHVGRR